MQIKSCPFCGEIPYLERRPLWQEYDRGVIHGYRGCFEYVIKCNNPKCGCSVKLGANDTIYNSDEVAKINALNAWNRRAE